MLGTSRRRWSALWQRGREFLEGSGERRPAGRPLLGRLQHAARFLYLIWHGFSANRCPARAAGLSYTTLLALVPLLAVTLSVAKNFLAETTEAVVPQLLDKVVTLVAPQLEYMPLAEDVDGPPAPGQAVVSARARQEAVANIQSFINNIDAGTLGTISSLFLVFVAIRLLMTIEQSFNDIWGVQRGRSIWRKVVYYWTTITLGPLLLILALGFTGTVEFATLFGRLKFVPGLERSLLRLIPFLLLWAGFSLMYGLMPNTRVRFRAALVGGMVGGTLWQLNSWLSALYLSRVVTYSKIYGSLGIVPIFLVGLYFSWLIILLGAQVSFAAQNARTYWQQRVAERIDQEQRELAACRIMLAACQEFLLGRPPLSPEELASQLDISPQLLNQLVQRLVDGGVLVEVAGEPGGWQPARTPDSLTVVELLRIIRTNPDRPGNLPGLSPTDPVASLLAQLHAAAESAPANLTFADLVSRTNPAAG